MLGNRWCLTRCLGPKSGTPCRRTCWSLAYQISNMALNELKVASNHVPWMESSIKHLSGMHSETVHRFQPSAGTPLHQSLAVGGSCAPQNGSRRPLGSTCRRSRLAQEQRRSESHHRVQGSRIALLLVLWLFLFMYSLASY